MESARRGPRCARRLLTTLEALPPRQVPPIHVHVLEGGFDQWVRRFWQEGDLRIQGFDDDYWGFAMPSADAVSDPAHILYERPADQPETPWSKAGASIQIQTDGGPGGREEACEEGARS